MPKTLSVAVASVGLVLAVSPVWAHHAFAADNDGKVTSWMVEGGSPNILLRRGFNKNTLEKGQHIVVDGFQAKDGSNRANGSNITYPDGKKLFLGSSGTGAPVDPGPGK